MAASDAQMQQYANERLRVRAEQFRAIIAACKDDKLAIDAIYDRAANGPPWADDRINDAPPKLLDQQDFLVYNAFISDFINLIDNGILGNNLAVFQSACVRPVLS